MLNDVVRKVCIYDGDWGLNSLLVKNHGDKGKREKNLVASEGDTCRMISRCVQVQNTLEDIF